MGVYEELFMTDCHNSMFRIVERMIEKNNKLIDQKGKDIDQSILDQQVFLQNFIDHWETDFKTVLNQWIADGTFDTLLNETALGLKVDQEIFEQSILSLNQQLADSVKHSEPESIGMSMLKTDIKDALSSGEWTFNVNRSEIAKKSVGIEKLSDNIDLFAKAEIYTGKVITGYDMSTKKVEISDNATFSVLKVKLPKRGTASFPYEDYFSGITYGQFMYISDEDDKYVYQQNGRPLNVNRTGWVQSDGGTSVFVDFNMISNSDVYLYLCYQTRTIEDRHMYAVGSVSINDLKWLDKQSLSEIFVGGETFNLELIIPSKYPIVIGETAYVSMNSIIYGRDLYREPFQFHATRPATEKMVELVQTNSSQLNTIFRGYEKDKLIIEGTLDTLAVPKTAGTGKTKNVMFIGESTTQAENFMQGFVDKMTGDPLTVNLIGQRGTTPNEGYSGWTSSELIGSATRQSVTNNFYNVGKGSFDYAFYKTTFGTPTLDYCFINFGINDMSQGISIATTLNNIQQMINSIKASDPNCRFIIGLTNNYSMHENYNVAYVYQTYKRIQELHKAILSAYDKRESEGYFIAPFYLNIDPIWDMQWDEVDVNVLNTRKKTYKGVDNVHPGQIGYKKTSQVAYNTLKYAVSLE